MELREIFVTALAIMDERGRSAGGSEILWTRDWERLRGLLLEGLDLIDEVEEIVGLVSKHGDPVIIDRGLDDGAYARGHRGCR